MIRTVRYIHKQNEKIKTGRIRANDYWDYLVMLTANTGISHYENRSINRYQKDFRRAHDEEARRYKNAEDAKKTKGVADHASKLAALRWEKDGILIMPAATPGDMAKEGSALCHCVASYVDGVASGRNAIFFIRHSEEPDKSWFTLELDENNRRVVQNRGMRNCARTEEVEAFEEAWIERVRHMRRSKEGVWSEQ